MRAYLAIIVYVPLLLTIGTYSRNFGTPWLFAELGLMQPDIADKSQEELACTFARDLTTCPVIYDVAEVVMFWLPLGVLVLLINLVASCWRALCVSIDPDAYLQEIEQFTQKEI